VLTGISSTGGCVLFNNNLINCPASAAGVTLTLTGQNFGFFGATVGAVCQGAATHVWPRASEKLTCTLRAAPGGFAVTLPVTVTTAGGTSNALQVRLLF
jgi:hypothetical protein